MNNLYFMATEQINGWNLGTVSYTVWDNLPWEQVEQIMKRIARQTASSVKLEVWSTSSEDPEIKEYSNEKE